MESVYTTEAHTLIFEQESSHDDIAVASFSDLMEASFQVYEKHEEMEETETKISIKKRVDEKEYIEEEKNVALAIKKKASEEIDTHGVQELINVSGETVVATNTASDTSVSETTHDENSVMISSTALSETKQLESHTQEVSAVEKQSEASFEFNIENTPTSESTLPQSKLDNNQIIDQYTAGKNQFISSKTVQFNSTVNFN